MSQFTDIAALIGELVDRKNAAYGDAIATTGNALCLLYPMGISVDEMDDALIVDRIWDKLKNIANNRDALGELPYTDIAGYAIFSVDMQQIAASESKQPKKETRVVGPDVPPPMSKAGLPETPWRVAGGSAARSAASWIGKHDTGRLMPASAVRTAAATWAVGAAAHRRRSETPDDRGEDHEGTT